MIKLSQNRNHFQILMIDSDSTVKLSEGRQTFKNKVKRFPRT